MTGLTAEEKAYLVKRDRKIVELARAGYWDSNIAERFGISPLVVERIRNANGVHIQTRRRA